MNNSHIKGTIKDVKGKVKEEVGHFTGNEKMESQGIGGQILGKVEKTFGDVKDAVKEKIDTLLHKDSKESKH